MSYAVYKVLHLLGVITVFLAAGGFTLQALGQPRVEQTAAWKLAGRTHGIALLLVLVSGFGLLARLGIEHDWLFPPWVWGKLLVWLALGASVAVVRRRPEWSRGLWWTLPILGLLAAALVVYKPGGGGAT